MHHKENKTDISVVIGLGNPGPSYYKTRHNIGFRVLDAFCEKHNGSWKKKDNYLFAQIMIHEKPILLIKPQTGMNVSGAVMPHLLKKNAITSIMAVYDDMEKEFGTLQIRQGGSHRGHNGVRSLMQYGEQFWRLRFGIGRPADKHHVSEYVLAPFTQDEEKRLQEIIDAAMTIIESHI
jgi:peptidyl-tRNA hydrolase, PTH1 family